MATLSTIIGRPSDNIPPGLTPAFPNVFLCSNPLLFKLQRKDYVFTSRGNSGGFLTLTGTVNTTVDGTALYVNKPIRVYNDISGTLPAGLRGEGKITAINTGTHVITTNIPYNAGLDTIFATGWFFHPNLENNTGEIKYTITAYISSYPDLALEQVPDPDGYTIIDFSELAKSALARQGDRLLTFPPGDLSGGSGPEYNRIDVGQSYGDFIKLVERWEDTVHPDGVDIAASEPPMYFVAGCGQITDLFKSNMSEYSRDCEHFEAGIYPGNNPIADAVNVPFTGISADLVAGERTYETIMTLRALPSFFIAKPTLVGGALYRHPASDYILTLGNMFADTWSVNTYVGIIFRLAGEIVLQRELLITVPGAVDGDPMGLAGNVTFDLPGVPMFDTCTLYFKNAVGATSPLVDFYQLNLHLVSLAKFLNKFKEPYMYRGYPFTLVFLDQCFNNPDPTVNVGTLRLEMLQYDKDGNDITEYGAGVDHLSYLDAAHRSLISRLTIFSKPWLDADGLPEIKNAFILPLATKLKVRLVCDADPDPRPTLTQWLTINVFDPCEDGILLYWKGWNGADHYYMFTKFFERQHQYQDGRAVKRMLLSAEDLSVEDWTVLNELNSSNLMYRTNITDMNPTTKAQRIGSLIYAVGADFDLTGVVVIPTESKIKNRNERRRIEILVEFPELYQP